MIHAIRFQAQPAPQHLPVTDATEKTNEQTPPLPASDPFFPPHREINIKSGKRKVLAPWDTRWTRIFGKPITPLPSDLRMDNLLNALIDSIPQALFTTMNSQETDPGFWNRKGGETYTKIGPDTFEINGTAYQLLYTIQCNKKGDRHLYELRNKQTGTFLQLSDGGGIYEVRYENPQEDLVIVKEQPGFQKLAYQFFNKLIEAREDALCGKRPSADSLKLEARLQKIDKLKI